MSAKSDASPIIFGASSLYKGPIPEELTLKKLNVTGSVDVGDLNVTGTFSYSNINASAIVQTNTLTEFTPGANISVENNMNFTKPNAPIGLTIFDLAGSTSLGLATLGGIPVYASNYVPIRSTSAAGYTFSGAGSTPVETLLARIEYNATNSRAQFATSEITPLSSNGVLMDSLIVGTTGVAVPGGLRFDSASDCVLYCNNAGTYVPITPSGITAGSGLTLTGNVMSVNSTQNLNNVYANVVNVGSAATGSFVGSSYTAFGTENMIINTQGTTGHVRINNALFTYQDKIVAYQPFSVNTGSLTMSGAGANTDTNMDTNGKKLIIKSGSANIASMDSTGVSLDTLRALTGSNIAVKNSITMDAGTFINGVDIANFYTDYQSKIDQSLKTTSGVNFANVTASNNITSINSTVSNNALVTNLYATNLYGGTLKSDISADAGVKIDGVDISAFYSDYNNKVPQAVGSANSPTFAGLTVTGTATAASVGTSEIKTASGTGNITLSNNLVPASGVTIAGVNIANFNSDYNSKVNQAVTTSSTPTFSALTLTGASGLTSTNVSSTTVKTGTISTVSGTGSISLANNILPSPGITYAGVDVAAFYADYNNKINQPLLSTSGPSFAGLTLTGPVNTSSTIAGIDLASVISNSNPLLITSSPTFQNLTLTGASSCGTTIRSSTSTGIDYIKFGTPTGSSAPNKAGIFVRGTGSNSRNKMFFALDNTTDETTTGEVQIAKSIITLDYSGNVMFNYRDLDTSAYNIGMMSTSDLMTSAMTYRYGATGTTTRDYVQRIQSGNAPGGLNRVEYYGMNNTYNSGSTGADGFTKTLGFRFTQKQEPSTTYNTLLDLDLSGVTVGSTTTPVTLNVTGQIRQAYNNKMSFTSDNVSTDYFMCTNGSTANGLQFTAHNNGVNYMKPTLTTEALELQSWDGTTPSTVLRIASNMVSFNRALLNTSPPSLYGGIGRGNSTLQFHDGTATRDVCLKSLDSSTNGTFYGPNITISSDTTYASTGITMVIGGTFTSNGSAKYNFTGRWVFSECTFSANITTGSSGTTSIAFDKCVFNINADNIYDLTVSDSIRLKSCTVLGSSTYLWPSTSGIVVFKFNAGKIDIINNYVRWDTMRLNNVSGPFTFCQCSINSKYGICNIRGNDISVGPTGSGGNQYFYLFDIKLGLTSWPGVAMICDNALRITTANAIGSRYFIFFNMLNGNANFIANAFTSDSSVIVSGADVYPLLYAFRSGLYTRNNMYAGIVNSAWRDETFATISVLTDNSIGLNNF